MTLPVSTNPAGLMTVKTAAEQKLNVVVIGKKDV